MGITDGMKVVKAICVKVEKPSFNRRGGVQHYLFPTHSAVLLSLPRRLEAIHSWPHVTTLLTVVYTWPQVTVTNLSTVVTPARSIDELVPVTLGLPANSQLGLKKSLR